MRGRKPKPTLMKQLNGNPGKRPLNDREPVPPAGTPTPPDYLDDVARQEWFHTCLEPDYVDPARRPRQRDSPISTCRPRPRYTHPIARGVRPHRSAGLRRTRRT